MMSGARTSDPDLALLEAWRDGDLHAGEALFRRHFDSLCRFFRNKLPDGVDDLIQRTFLACVERRDQFEGRASFRTYLFVVARNTLIRELGKRQRSGARFEPLETSVEQLMPSAVSVVARRREDRQLLEALRKLPVDHQIALELYFWEDMSAAAIGDVLGLPEGTVRTRIRRARQLLAAELDRLEASGSLRTTAQGIDAWARDLRKLVEPS